MTSKRDLEQRLSALEDSAPTTITLAETYTWIRALNDRGCDAGRPTDYFGADIEWSESMREQHASVIARHPELEEVTPAEAYVLGYMDDATQRKVLELLVADSTVESF